MVTFQCSVKKLILPSFLPVVLSVALLSQTPDGWHDLVLDETTVEDAINALGKPNKDKIKQKLGTIIGYRINTDLRYRKLEYKKPKGMDKVELYFLDAKLVAIDLDLKKNVNPNSLAGEYGVDFSPSFSGVNVTYGTGRQEPVEGSVSYPRVYHVVGVAETAFIVAQVKQGTFSHIGKSIGSIQEDPTNFPGKVGRIQLISRALE